MLTTWEKLLFAAFVLACVWNGYWAFKKVYEVIRRGHGEVDDEHIARRTWNAFVEWATLKPTWQVRPVSDLFHAMVAWGFIFYFLINFGDVIEGYFDVIFLGTGVVGQIYRLLADLVSGAVIVGMVYFLVRRFISKDPALSFHDNVKLMDKVKAGGLKRDSLIVGAFILAHVGFRFLGVSFAIALD